MLLRELVKKLQAALNKANADRAGTWVEVDGEYGPRTISALNEYDIEIVLKIKPAPIKPISDVDAPWLDEAKKHEGKKETDSNFSAFMSGFWKFVGLPGFTSIVGSARAWCGLFGAMGLIAVGMQFPKDGAGAKNWDKFGVAIDWKAAGIPRGAFVRINHAGNCSSGSGNHIAMADGDCAPEDLTGSINLYGGNQGDMAKVSAFPVAHICSVRWPSDAEKPQPVTKSKGCKGSSGGDTTR